MIRKLTPSNGISPFSGQYGQQSSQGTTPIPVPLGGGGASSGGGTGGGGGGGGSSSGSSNVEAQYEQVINLAKQIRKKILMSNFEFLRRLLDNVPSDITAKIIEAPHGIQLWSGQNNVEAPLPVFAICNSSGYPYTDIGVYSPKLYKVSIDAESIYEYMLKKHAELVSNYKLNYVIVMTDKGPIVLKLSSVYKMVYDIIIYESDIKSFVYPKETPPDFHGGLSYVQIHVIGTEYEFPPTQYSGNIRCTIGYIGYFDKNGNLVGGYGIKMEVDNPTSDIKFIQFPKLGTLPVGENISGTLCKIVTDNWTLVGVYS